LEMFTNLIMFFHDFFIDVGTDVQFEYKILTLATKSAN
jgi:hypothetical protein